MKTLIPESTHSEAASLQADRQRIAWVEEYVATVRAEADGKGELPVWRVRDPAGELLGEGDTWREAVDAASRK